MHSNYIKFWSIMCIAHRYTTTFEAYVFFSFSVIGHWLFMSKLGVSC